MRRPERSEEPTSEVHAVTGAFGYTGRYIARRLLAAGHRVVTLTSRQPAADPFGGRVERVPLSFDRPDDLARSLSGVHVLYNTYWVRFNHRRFTYADAVRNTEVLFAAARRAGVERIVHVSITNPSPDSRLEYFRGKAEIEAALHGSGIPHSILRPAVLFGGEDILINNIAWMLRRFPVFGVFGRGDYQLQPIHVDDLAALAVESGSRSGDTRIEAIGPETFTYRRLVDTIGRAIGRRRPLIPIPRLLGYAIARVMGHFLADVVITWDEIRGLTSGLLHVEAPAAGTTRLTDWARENADTLGRSYASELARRLP